MPHRMYDPNRHCIVSFYKIGGRHILIYIIFHSTILLAPWRLDTKPKHAEWRLSSTSPDCSSFRFLRTNAISQRSFCDEYRNQ